MERKNSIFVLFSNIGRKKNVCLSVCLSSKKQAFIKIDEDYNIFLDVP